MSSTLKVVFWNVYNLFEAGAGDRRPASPAELTAKIAAIGKGMSDTNPDIIGLAEIETERLLKEIIKASGLKMQYHWEPPPTKGETGLAFIYSDESVAKIVRTEAEQTGLIRPRVLMVECILVDDPAESVVFFVNHWKSQMKGSGKSERLASGAWVRERIDAYGRGKCIVAIGDFNAEPFDVAFRSKGMRAARFFRSATSHGMMYNTSWRLLAEPDFWDKASGDTYQLPRPRTSHDGAGNVIFDQILVSGGALRGGPLTLRESTVGFYHGASVASRTRLRIAPRRFQFDSNAGSSAGASDHLPVLADFTKARIGGTT